MNDFFPCPMRKLHPVDQAPESRGREVSHRASSSAARMSSISEVSLARISSSRPETVVKLPASAAEP